MSKDRIIIAGAAMVAHEANRAWCLANGDDSQPLWDDAPDWQKDSAIKGVQFHMDNPDAGDSASHDNWMAQKDDEGWCYGPVKDPENKTHPCMVPFEELPEVQQRKDTLFRAIVHALVAVPAETPFADTRADNPNVGPTDEQSIEEELRAKGLDAPRLSPELIDETIVDEDFYVFPGSQLTACCLTLRNGYTVTGESACASPKNFNAEIGRKIARSHAREKIWGLEGYLLKERLTQAA